MGRTIAALLLLAASVVDLWLLFHALQGAGVAGCGGTGGCDDVLSSRWAYWLGLPVSLPALSAHLALLAGLFFRHKNVEILCGALGIAIIGTALWFFALQALVLERYCPFCLSTHLLGVIAAVLVLWLNKRSLTRNSLILGIAGLGILIVPQLLWPTERLDINRTTNETVEAEQPLELAIPERPPAPLRAGLGYVDPRAFPHLGDPDAEHIAALVFDFTCAHCRRSYHALTEYLETTDKRLCILLLPASLHPDCNPYIGNALPEHTDACGYARLALALWHEDPEQFYALTAEFLQPTASAPPLEDAHQWANDRLGEARLQEALASSVIEKELRRNIDTFATTVRETGMLQMPKLITPATIISGASDDVTTYRHGLDPETGSWWD